MPIITLKDFYKKVEKAESGEQTFIELKDDLPDVSFEILRTIGAGNSGYVFLAVHTEKKFVALRLSYEEDDFNTKLYSIMHEMGDEYKKYLLELFYPCLHMKHILVGKETFFFDKEVFMSVWEPADGTLAAKLDESFENKYKWFRQFLKGLWVIHSRKRLHLDIKLANLFLVDDVLKIGDLEIYLKEDEFLNAPPYFCGTIGYIAPEMFYDPEKVSTKSDIFSSGVAFCELFIGVKLESNFLKPNNILSIEENIDLQALFGGKPLSIISDRKRQHFIANFKKFNFFRRELLRKLGSEGIPEKERKIYEFILTMIEIAPEKREDVGSILFKLHEMDFDPELLIGKTLLGRYKIQELIDGGGRGIVYKVWDPIEEVAKAIKLFPPKFNFIKDGFDQIKNELQLTNKIIHRNVMRCYGLERDGELNFILMEYIKGFNLKKKFESIQGGKLNEVEALTIMKQVASGLIEAHRDRVIHRNLKDKNIMITGEEGYVKIINFGLSLKIKKSIADITGKDALGRESMLVASPEQRQALFETLTEENEQTDVWGFGVVLYQLLAGIHPFSQADEKSDTRTIPAISGIRKNINAVLMRCLEENRLKRYRNMEEVYDALFGDQIINVKYQGTGRSGIIENISGAFKRVTKKWVLGLIFVLIAATLWLILGTSIITDREKYAMWYSGKPRNAETPGGGIGYASSSNGIQWERDKNNPIIPQGGKGSFNEFESSLPFVVNDGNYFYMLFSGSIKTGNGFEYHIGYARFENIDKWTKNNIERVTLDNGNIKFPGPILYIDEYYKMWYTESDAIYYACTRVKGQPILDMIRHSGNPILSRGNTGEWDNEGVVIGYVLYEDWIYRMWYTGKSLGESKIGYAISTNGIDWDKFKYNPVFDDKDVTLEMNPCVIHDSTGYKMYYTAATTGIEYYPVRLATSTDGITWRKYSNTPVLDTGSGDWENKKIFVTGVKVEKK